MSSDELKAKGRGRSRKKYQRPKVYLVAGKGEGKSKLWRAEWRIRVEGRDKPIHRAKTWPCSQFSKSAAQKECDRLVQDETSGVAKPDASVTVGDFFAKIFWPTAVRRLAKNSVHSYLYSYRTYLSPAIGAVELQAVTKNAIEVILGKMADAGKGAETVTRVKNLASQIFSEALENGNITRNPARKVELPRTKEKGKTRSLTEEEVCRLFAETTGRNRLIWRILVLTGARIGELMALTKSDLTVEGLRFDESALDGKPSSTKNRKIRTAPIPATLRQEIIEYANTVLSDLLFPSVNGNMQRRSNKDICRMVKAARAAAGIPDLTPRMCRTTFATLFNSDPSDVQAILGHSSIDTTSQFYRKGIVSRQQLAVEELDSRLTKTPHTIQTGAKGGSK